MFCSGCGQLLESGRSFCPRCGKPATQAEQMNPAVPPVPGPVPDFDLLVRNYAGKVKVLAILWFVYAALSVLAGFAGLAFLRAFASGSFGSWMGASAPPSWVFPSIVHFVWIAIVIRAILAVIAGWGLLERTQWGRVIAIVAAIFALIRFPLGTALGIATLVILLGGRNSALYERI